MIVYICVIYNCNITSLILLPHNNFFQYINSSNFSKYFLERFMETDFL